MLPAFSKKWNNFVFTKGDEIFCRSRHCCDKNTKMINPTGFFSCYSEISDGCNPGSEWRNESERSSSEWQPRARRNFKRAKFRTGATRGASGEMSRNEVQANDSREREGISRECQSYPHDPKQAWAWRNFKTARIRAIQHVFGLEAVQNIKLREIIMKYQAAGKLNFNFNIK